MTEHRIWNQAAETIPREDLEQLQLERLQSTINRVYRHVKYYRNRFDELGLQPGDIRTRRTLVRSPLPPNRI